MNDDENNNLGQDYTKMEKDFTKNAKKITTTTIKTTGKILKGIIRVIGIKAIALVAAIMIFFLSIAGFWYVIKNSEYKESSTVAYKKMIGKTGLANKIINEIDIDKRRYELDSKELKEEIKKWFEEKGINTVELANEDGELEGLEAFIEAEVRSSFPDLRERDKIGEPAEEGEVQGTIQFERRLEGTDTKIKLEYMPYEEFIDKLREAGMDIEAKRGENRSESEVMGAYNELFSRFTLDEDYNLVLANLSTESIKTIYSQYAQEEGNPAEENEFYYVIEAKTIDYSNISKKYRMPFEFLIALLMNSQNYVFCNEVANLTKKHAIIVDVQDYLTTEIITEEYSCDVQIKVEEGASYYEAPDYSNSNSTYGSGEGTIPVHPYKTKITTKKENEVELKVATAKTWVYNYKAIYTRLEEPGQGMYEEASWGPDEDFHEVSNSHGITAEGLYIPSDAMVYSTWSKISERKYNKKLDITEEITTTSYNKTVAVDEIVPERFLSLLQVDPDLIDEETEKPIYNVEERSKNTEIYTYKSTFLSIEKPLLKQYIQFSPISNLSSAQRILYEFLASNVKTANLEEVMRYLMDVLEGRRKVNRSEDLSILRENGEEFGTLTDRYASKPRQYTTMGYTNLSQLKRYIRSWEHATPPPTSADGTCYVIERGSAGEPVVGYGIDINSHRTVFEMAGYSTTIGSLVPIEFVDMLEDEEIMSNLEKIKALTSGINLTGYQINALVSRAYNCGLGSLTSSGSNAGAIGIRNGKNFVQAYNAYWDEARDDQYPSRNNNANFSHSLYTLYMSKPVTSGGKYLSGLERRRRSEWTLFQTGYYDTLGEWHSEDTLGGIPGFNLPRPTSGGSVLEACKKLTEYLRARGVTYGTVTSHNIEKTYTQDSKIVCTTYTVLALYQMGWLTAEQINPYNYHYTRDLPKLLTNAGWHTVDINNLQPGDVLNKPGDGNQGHTVIYVGDGLIYDQNSATKNSGPKPVSNYINGYTAWRAP